MGVLQIFEKGGEGYHDYKKALKMAAEAIDTLCDLTEEMEDEYGYEERSSYSRREGRDGMRERMSRRSYR